MNYLFSKFFLLDVPDQWLTLVGLKAATDPNLWLTSVRLEAATDLDP